MHLFRPARLLAAALSLITASALAAPGAPPPPTYRIEVHPIPSVDLTTAEALTGKADGAARTIAGELRLPVSTQARLPAVIFLHGDAGALANQALWIDEFNALGIAVFTVDSFSARGAIAKTPGLQVDGAGLIGSAGRVADAYRALAVLAAHPRIDAQRIALMGVSSGGRVVLNSAMTRFARQHAPAGASFAAFVALYPPCNLTLDGDTALLPAPLQIHHGAADVVTRADACRQYAARVRRAGGNAEFFEYAEAPHGYDSPAGMPPNALPQAANASRCNFVERDGGRLVNADTERPVTLADACVSTGLGGGHHAQAANATRAVVKSFLRTVFKLAP